MGGVGSALVRMILPRKDEFRKRYGFDLGVVAVADSRSSAVDENGLDLRRVLLNKKERGLVGEEKDSVKTIGVIKDTDADVVVELTPGNPTDAEPGLSHVRTALSTGKHVVIANKMPLALRYRELSKDAARRGLWIKYSACVGGGLPVIDLADACMLTDTVTEIKGTLNATSNFILSDMEDRKVDFKPALAEAQRLGCAEADPRLDIDGVDAACKIVILANHVFEEDFTLSDVRPLEGIGRISLTRVAEAGRRGKKLRMIARAREGVEVKVVELPQTNSLCVVGPSNAVRFECRSSGPRIVAGLAGGGVTTSAAVLRDLIAIGRHGIKK